MRRAWTTSDLDLIESCIYSAAELAEIFGVSCENIHSTIFYHKLKYKKVAPRYTTEELNKMSVLYLRGVSIVEIARRFKRPVVVVGSRLRKLAGKRKTKLWNRECEQFIIDNFKFMTNVELAKHFSISRGAVEAKINKLRKSGLMGLRDKTI